MQVVENALLPWIKRLRIRLDSKREWAGINPQGLTGCGKRLEFKKKIPKSVPQGLKPIDFIGFIGTTEVVPFQSEQIPFSGSSFSAASNARGIFFCRRRRG
jgi:hypothetical protein